MKIDKDTIKALIEAAEIAVEGFDQIQDGADLCRSDMEMASVYLERIHYAATRGSSVAGMMAATLKTIGGIDDD